jgi:hypothetical protein
MGGQEVNGNVGESETVISTEWSTGLGIPINTNEITYSGSVICGDTTYIVNAINWDGVYPCPVL